MMRIMARLPGDQLTCVNAEALAESLEVAALAMEMSSAWRRKFIDMMHRQLRHTDKPITGHGLRPRWRRFLDEYFIDMNVHKAARRAGYKHGPTGYLLLRKPRIMREVHRRMQELQEKSTLDAEYVRRYILGVLEFCPTDYFMVAPDGDMVLDPVVLTTMPTFVRKLIDRIEVRYIGGKKYYRVEFVSKSAALAIAARFTLTQKFEGTISAVPWDEVMAPAEDVIEQKLQEYHKRPSAEVIDVVPSTNGHHGAK